VTLWWSSYLWLAIKKHHRHGNTLSIFRMIRSAHCTDAAINLSVSGLPLGVPNKSLAVRMYRREDCGLRLVKKQSESVKEDARNHDTKTA
jgi:hypothetical protein